MLFGLISLAPFFRRPGILFSFHVVCYSSLYLMGVSTFVSLGPSTQNSVLIVGVAFRASIVFSPYRLLP